MYNTIEDDKLKKYWNSDFVEHRLELVNRGIYLDVLVYDEDSQVRNAV